MKKVFDEVYTLDRRCYEEYGLNEDILMENAAQSLARVIRDRVERGKKILIVSGGGNNGADGVTLSRILHKEYEVFLFLPMGAKSNMCKIQLDRAKKVGVNIVSYVAEADVVVDALFGSGLNKPLKSEAVDVVESLNKIEAFKIACDIPSGIDSSGNISPVAFKANITVSMGAYKKALFSDFAKDYVGEIVVADLGVSRDVYEGESDTYLLEESDFRTPVRTKISSNKGDYGHTVLLCGEKEGACMIAAKAAFAFGSGLCSVVSKRDVSNAPYEIMVSKKLPSGFSSVVMGMGLGKEYDRDMLLEITNKKEAPLVVDADLFRDEMILQILKDKRDLILTPHPKEFASLLSIVGIKKDANSSYVQKNRFDLAREFSQIYKDRVLILKGSNTLIAQNGKIYINTFGTNALSKGGSGDVLSGLAGSLLSQGYSPLDAAINASLAHSLSAKRYKKANYSLSPFDIIEVVKELA